MRRARADLAADLERIELPERALVTSSALLDLVSAEWLDALVRRCVGASADVYFSLIYDGRTVCTPADDADAEVLELFNRHQRGDKGFGAALGPTAGLRAVDAFVARGYRVASRTSDWRIGPSAAPFQRELLAGWLGAALEIAPQRRAALDAWYRRRVAHVDAGAIDARRRSPRHDRNLHALAARARRLGSARPTPTRARHRSRASRNRTARRRPS